MTTNKSKPGILFPPAVGYNLGILVSFIINHKISLRYVPRTIIIFIINLINLPFRTYERLFINTKYKGAKIENPPIFIIGHWRSGTTYLHSLLSKDTKFGYVSTYQSVFPDTLFVTLGRMLFKGFTTLLIPGRRPGDNVSLHPSYPQEEEFALGVKTPLCFYYMWMFPRVIRDFYNTSIRFNNVDASMLKDWEQDYKLLINKALKNTGGNIFLSKNPPNTGRVKQLQKMFPNAKFIHIHRNPIDVYMSTRNFYKRMMPHLQLQSISEEEIVNSIIDIYKSTMQDFIACRNEITSDNLIEVSYADLEKKPLELIEKIYESFEIEGFKNAKPLFKDFIDEMVVYKKNKHYISNELLKRITSEFGFAMKEYGYNIPDNLETF